MKFSEAREEIGNEIGRKKFNFDLKNNHIVISVLLTHNGCGAPFPEFEIDLDVEDNFWNIDNDSILKRKIKELNINLPKLPKNPNFTLGYNDPAVDLVAYWNIEDIIEDINIEDIGVDSWFTADENSFYGSDKELTAKEENFVRKILFQRVAYELCIKQLYRNNSDHPRYLEAVDYLKRHGY